MKVAVLGFGTVGKGVYDMLGAARGLEQGPVLVRPGKDDAPYKLTSLEAILSDPTVDAVAEVMGGVEPAYSYCSAALAAGKHVVTSNKALVAAKGIELNKLAEEHGVSFLFSAACGGAVPFLHNLSLAVESDTIERLGGILNGTTNYMLDAMQRRGWDYLEALVDAQHLGYAEKDPTADVSGLDALRKIMLACAVSYNKLPVDGFDAEGIEHITAEDVSHFQSLGYTCRLLVNGSCKDGAVSAYVEPVLFKAGAPECSVLDNFNMAKYVGTNSGLIVLMGQGAGRYPTASAVLRDLSDIRAGRQFMMSPACERVVADNSTVAHRYYIRVPAAYAYRFSAEETMPDGGNVRIITAPINVSTMHKRVQELRKDGAAVFFAAINE